MHYNSTPSPYDLLCTFHNAKMVSHVVSLLERNRSWFVDNLNPDQQANVQKIEADLAVWMALEKKHGVGAAMDLDSSFVKKALDEASYFRKQHSTEIENARKYKRDGHVDKF